jgi:hypothetical protein
VTPEQRRSKAIEAQQFMRHPAFNAMFEGVAQALESKALSCPATDEKLAADVIRCKQLLAAIKREVERRAEDGDFAAFEIEQLEKKGVVQRLLRR